MPADDDQHDGERPIGHERQEVPPVARCPLGAGHHHDHPGKRRHARHKGAGRSPSHTQASRTAKNGTVPTMRVTLTTVVNFSAGIYATIVMAYASVTITSGQPMTLTAWKTPRRSVHTRYNRMKGAPKMPRQNRIVQALASIRRMK